MAARVHELDCRDRRLRAFPPDALQMPWLRKLVLEAAPDLTLEWKWDTAVWSHNGLVCAVGAFKDNAGLNFFKGASLPDPNKLFNAGLDAKKTRAIDFREGDAVDESALKDLIRAAIAHNVG